jgi:hypothetical protein
MRCAAQNHAVSSNRTVHRVPAVIDVLATTVEHSWCRRLFPNAAPCAATGGDKPLWPA